MFEKDSRVIGQAGVFFADRAASGVVVGNRAASKSAPAMVGVRVDGEQIPAWVPAASVKEA